MYSLIRAKTGKQILPVANCFYHPFRVRFSETWALLPCTGGDREPCKGDVLSQMSRRVIKIFRISTPSLCVDIKATTEPRRWGNWCDEARHTRHGRTIDNERMFTSHHLHFPRTTECSVSDREGWLDGDVLGILPSNGKRDFSIFMQIVSSISFTDLDSNMF